MRKLLFAAAVGLCTMPAMAAGPAVHPLLAHPQAAAASRAAPGSSRDLPLPPIQLETSFAAPASGQAGQAAHSTDLPGLGVITSTSNNPGQGKGQAKYAGQLNIDPAASQAPTKLSADYAVPQRGQFSANYDFQGKGYGKPSDPNLKPLNLPVGTITPDYDNGGKGKSVDASLNYTSPPPKK